MKRILPILVIVALLGAGVWYAFGGGTKDGENFGAGTGATVTPIGDILKSPDTYVGQTVTIEGTMTQECPSAGCWWYTRDATGEIRTDSQGGNFALPLHQENRVIRTTGKVIKGEGGALEIAATGAAFK